MENYKTIYHVINIDKTRKLLFHPFSLKLYEILDSSEGNILKLYEEFKNPGHVADILNINESKV